MAHGGVTHSAGARKIDASATLHVTMEQLLFRTIRVASFLGLAALATLLTMFFGTSRSASNLSSDGGFTGFGIQCANADAPVVDTGCTGDAGCAGCAGSDSGCSGGCDSGGGGSSDGCA